MRKNPTKRTPPIGEGRGRTGNNFFLSPKELRGDSGEKGGRGVVRALGERKPGRMRVSKDESSHKRLRSLRRD